MTPFRQRIGGPAWLRGLGVVAALLVVGCVPVFVAGIAGAWGTDRAGVLLGGVILFTVCVVPAAVIALSNAMTVVVGPASVSGHLVPLRVFRIELAQIVETRAVNVEPREAGGIGYRLTPHGRFLLLDAGPALEIVTRDGRRYVLRSPTPGLLQDEIKNAQFRNRNAPQLCRD